MKNKTIENIKEDEGMKWLEDNVENAIKGINLLVAQMYNQLRESPEKLALVLLLRRDGRKHLAELCEELSLNSKYLSHIEKALERYGIVSSELDKAPEGYPATHVRYVELTSMGETILMYLENEDETNGTRRSKQ